MAETFQEYNKPGFYRARPMAWTVRMPKDAEKSKSVSIAIRWELTQSWDAQNEAWSGPWPEGWGIYSDSYFIGKDGTPNKRTLDMLAEAGVWSGDFDQIASDPPNITAIIEIIEDTYLGKTRFKADWIQANSEVPKKRSGGFAPPDAAHLASLKAMFSNQIRAVVGGGSGAGLQRQQLPIPQTAPPAGAAPPFTPPAAPGGSAPGSPPPPPGAVAPPQAGAPQQSAAPPPYVPPAPPAPGGGPNAAGFNQLNPMEAAAMGLDDTPF